MNLSNLSGRYFIPWTDEDGKKWTCIVSSDEYGPAPRGDTKIGERLDAQILAAVANDPRDGITLLTAEEREFVESGACHRTLSEYRAEDYPTSTMLDDVCESADPQERREALAMRDIEADRRAAREYYGDILDTTRNSDLNADAGEQLAAFQNATETLRENRRRLLRVGRGDLAVVLQNAIAGGADSINPQRVYAICNAVNAELVCSGIR